MYWFYFLSSNKICKGTPNSSHANEAMKGFIIIRRIKQSSFQRELKWKEPWASWVMKHQRIPVWSSTKVKDNSICALSKFYHHGIRAEPSHFSQFRPSILMEQSRILVGSASFGSCAYKFKISWHGQQRECSLLWAYKREREPWQGTTGRRSHLSPLYSAFSRPAVHLGGTTHGMKQAIMGEEYVLVMKTDKVG